MTPPALLDIRAVAHRLSVSASTVERLIASGELEGVRVRRSIRVTPAALDAYISALKPCQSEKYTTGGKFASRSMDGASKKLYRPAPRALPLARRRNVNGFFIARQASHADCDAPVIKKFPASSTTAKSYCSKKNRSKNLLRAQSREEFQNVDGNTLRSNSQAIQMDGAKNRPNGTGVLPETRRPRSTRIKTTVRAASERAGGRAGKRGNANRRSV